MSVGQTFSFIRKQLTLLFPLEHKKRQKLNVLRSHINCIYLHILFGMY